MKRKIIIGVVGLSLLAATGCSQGTVQAVEKTSSTTESTKNENGEMVPDMNKDEVKAREEEQRMGTASIFGKVTRIVGNEVTIALIEMPEGDQAGNSGMGSAQRGQGAGMGGPPDGGRMTEPQLTGETVQLTIPVGIPINSRSKEGNEELEISDIIAGSMIMIWNNDSGYPIRVQLMGMR